MHDLRTIGRPDMTIAVDWDVEHQNKQIKRRKKRHINVDERRNVASTSIQRCFKVVYMLVMHYALRIYAKHPCKKEIVMYKVDRNEAQQNVVSH